MVNICKYSLNKRIIFILFLTINTFSSCNEKDTYHFPFILIDSVSITSRSLNLYEIENDTIPFWMVFQPLDSIRVYRIEYLFKTNLPDGTIINVGKLHRNGVPPTVFECLVEVHNGNIDPKFEFKRTYKGLDRVFLAIKTDMQSEEVLKLMDEELTSQKSKASYRSYLFKKYFEFKIDDKYINTGWVDASKIDIKVDSVLLKY